MDRKNAIGDRWIIGQTANKKPKHISFFFTPGSLFPYNSCMTNAKTRTPKTESDDSRARRLEAARIERFRAVLEAEAGL